MTSVHARIHDCWNRIGVHGDASCPELVQHIHCRNCPVYSTAAMELLNLRLPKGHLAHWTPLIAQKETDTTKISTQSAVIFRVGMEWLGLPTKVFKEVVGSRTIHSMPHRRNGVVLGLVNIRGELVMCASLSHLLGLKSSVAIKTDKQPERQLDKQRVLDWRLVMIEYEGARTAFPVDEVQGVQRYDPNELRKVPSTVSHATATYIKAILPWRDQSVGIVDELLVNYTLTRSLTLATTT